MAFTVACRTGLVILLSFHAGDGFRISNQKQVSGHKRGACDHACGAAKVTVDDVEFEIGSNVPYDRDDAECLSSCYIGTSGHKCGWGFDKKSKAGRAFDKKLCCKSQKCTWRPPTEDDPDSGKWEEKLDSEEQLWPLEDFEHGECPGNTCFCCSEAGLPWNGKVNLKCKFAYGPTSLGEMLKYGFAAAFSFGLSDLAWKQNCERYCINFPGYSVAKKAIDYHKWVPKEIPRGPPPAEVAAELAKQLNDFIGEAEAGLAVDHKSTDFDPASLIKVGDNIRDILEEAEGAEISAHFPWESKQNGDDTLEALNKVTMPKQLENAMARFGEALEGQATDNINAVEDVRDALGSAIFRAENSPLDINVQAAKSLMDALTEIVTEMKK